MILTSLLPAGSISKKILYIFLTATLIPILSLALVSMTYISSVIENDTHTDLIQYAKSYGLVTLEKIQSFESELKKISAITDSSLPENIASNLSNIELIPIKNYATSGFGKSTNPILNYFYSGDNALLFKIDLLHMNSENIPYILRGTFTLNSLFNNDSRNPFNEPICVFTELGEILFCNENIELKNAALNNANSLIRSSNRIINYKSQEDDYLLTSWELFLPSHFQSESWYFVILKKQNIALSAIKRFEVFIIPIALLFFMLVGFIIHLLIKHLLSPVDKLSQATKDIALGNYEIDLDIKTDDEFQQLGSSFQEMSGALYYQDNKDKVLLNFEHSALSTSSIHTAVEENYSQLIQLLDLKWLVISILRPDEKSISDSHIIKRRTDNKIEYIPISHESFDMQGYDKLFFEIDKNSFDKNFYIIAKSLFSPSAWVNRIKIQKHDVAYLLFATKNNAQPTTQCTSTLIEFSERFSNIYTTYEQRSVLYHRANYDELTNLPNRHYLLEILNRQWEKSVTNNTNLALFFIDLDYFKNVNDLSGHAAGNEVLQQVSDRLSSILDDNGILARLSGDEFCILIDSIEDRDHAERLAEKVLTQFSQPFVVKDMSHFLGASVGVAVGPQSISDPQSFIECADIAMFKAKTDGRMRYVLFNDKIEKDRNYRLSLEHYLHFALENNEIHINYQPKIDLRSGKLSGVECLARWHHHELGMIPTDNFISLAEESGLIIDIGEWILRKSCFQFMDWRKKEIEIDSISVNVSAKQIATNSFTDTVSSAISESGIPPHCLDLEITESAFINEQNSFIEQLEKLHDLGVKISIDDFGKEYSSLSYLKKIPFDTLKIDREFIIDLESDHRDQHIIDVIINIGHTLNKKIVAEGIETIKQRDILLKYQCDIGQGYLFSKPLTDIDFLAFATKYSQDRLATEFLQVIKL